MICLRYRIRQFATATRNYAKRQLQWYRKDSSFLWLKIDRKGVEKDDLAPYNKVCEEIKHWCAISPSDFDIVIQQQVQRGLAVTAARNRKKSGHRPKVEQPLDRLAFENVSTSKDMLTPFSLNDHSDATRIPSTDIVSSHIEEVNSSSIQNISPQPSDQESKEEYKYELTEQEEEAVTIVDA